MVYVWFSLFFFRMRPPPRFTRTYTLFTYTSLFRSEELGFRTAAARLCALACARPGAARHQPQQRPIPLAGRPVEKAAAVGREPHRAADRARPGVMAEILFLAHRAPWPPDRGDRIRSWHMLEALARLAPVHVEIGRAP